VHQDGLVHVSALADRFVKDPREVVKPGDIVKVKVLEVDLKRKRISLTMRLRDEGSGRASALTGTSGDRPLSQRERQHMIDKPRPGAANSPDNALAAAFSKAGFGVRK
jgi:protein Tex